ncbi:MAG: DUF1573 domain-containing protein [Marinifilaceae bacterium]
MNYRVVLISIFVSCALLACSHNGAKNSSKGRPSQGSKVEKRHGAKFEFTKEIHKFGAVSEGEILVCNFYYKNSGSEALIISDVETSCGCTAVKWDRKPLAPGKEAKISVEFNSAGRYGKQYKTVSIFANIPEKVKELIITAEVN